jgi:hypothetical protein
LQELLVGGVGERRRVARCGRGRVRGSTGVLGANAGQAIETCVPVLPRKCIGMVAYGISVVRKHGGRLAYRAGGISAGPTIQGNMTLGIPTVE